jgi:hypothetical protein
VDPRLRTTQKHIYAAGDVNGGPQFTHAAGYEGGIVVSNAVFRLPRRVNYTYLPWCTYADPPLASIGMNEKAAKAAGIDYGVDGGVPATTAAWPKARGSARSSCSGRRNPSGTDPGHAGTSWRRVAVRNGRELTTWHRGSPYPTGRNQQARGRKCFSENFRQGPQGPSFFPPQGLACTPPRRGFNISGLRAPATRRPPPGQTPRLPCKQAFMETTLTPNHRSAPVMASVSARPRNACVGACVAAVPADPWHRHPGGEYTPSRN